MTLLKFLVSVFTTKDIIVRVDNVEVARGTKNSTAFYNYHGWKVILISCNNDQFIIDIADL